MRYDQYFLGSIGWYPENKFSWPVSGSAQTRSFSVDIRVRQGCSGGAVCYPSWQRNLFLGHERTEYQEKDKGVNMLHWNLLSGFKKTPGEAVLSKKCSCTTVYCTLLAFTPGSWHFLKATSSFLTGTTLRGCISSLMIQGRYHGLRTDVNRLASPNSEYMHKIFVANAAQPPLPFLSGSRPPPFALPLGLAGCVSLKRCPWAPATTFQWAGAFTRSRYYSYLFIF